MDLDAAHALGHRLMATHGLDDWRLEWDRAVRRAGATRFRDRTISLSRRLTQLHSEEEVEDTILHEIAHALVGPRHGHDAAWQRRARAIGASGERCLADDSPRIEGRWVGICPAGHRTTRHRTPTRVVSCTRCSRAFDPRHLYTWTRDGEPAPMHPAYQAELARLANATRAEASEGPALGRGDAVRIVARGRFHGRTGVVLQRRRTRYLVRLREGSVTVPFGLVEPADERPQP